MLQDVAARMADAPDTAAAQALDWAFFATVVEAADNLVLALVMNSIRHVYFQRADLFARVVDEHEALAPLYAGAAEAIARRDAPGAARAVQALADAQAERLR